ncbi:hypothetical protein IF2G_10263 [Cordyceps javanica]|nr:hypothetical protein IF2G_10263 [Cordyceps javanica]
MAVPSPGRDSLTEYNGPACWTSCFATKCDHAMTRTDTGRFRSLLTGQGLVLLIYSSELTLCSIFYCFYALKVQSRPWTFLLARVERGRS